MHVDLPITVCNIGAAATNLNIALLGAWYQVLTFVVTVVVVAMLECSLALALALG
jgi:hypothetical protein